MFLFADVAKAAQSSGHLQGADYAMLIGYFALMLGIGVYFYSRMRGLKDYFSGGNSIPWWLSGTSFYMSSFSVFGFVAYSALAFKYGLVGVTLFWVTVPATLFSTLLFAKRWRRARIDSPVEYLETRYSSTFRQLLAWQGIPVKMVDDGLKLVAISTFLSVSLGLDIKASMIGSGVIILLYTFMGGLWAVTVTDFIQFVVMAIAVLILLPLSIQQVGGPTAFFENAQKGFFSLTNVTYNWWYIAILSLLYSVAWSSVNWPLIQRYYCVRDEKEAVKVGWLVTVLNIIGPPLMFIPAMAAAQFFNIDGGLAQNVAGEDVYPMLCIVLLPAGILGLVIAAMFAATMSMLSSDYNVCAGVFTNDVYKRLIRPSASQKELVTVGRLSTLVIGLFALGIALLMSAGTGEDLFKNMVTLFSVVIPPAGLPMIFGLLTKRITRHGAICRWGAGLAVGLVALFRVTETVTIYLFGGYSFELDPEVTIFAITSIVTLVVLWSVSLLTQDDSQKKQIDKFFERLDTPIGQMEEDAKTANSTFSPFFIVGISMFFIGLMMLGVLPWVIGPLAIGLDAGLAILMLLIGGIVVFRGKSKVGS